jgi:hypothetical protein
MIELLGVGVPRGKGEWLFRRLCERIEAPAFTMVTATSREAS